MATFRGVRIVESIPSSWDSRRRSRMNSLKRQWRLHEAKKRGTHTEKEWAALKAEFGGLCVKCVGASGLVNVEKDHIIPIYQGGSDSIENIQPLCARCNCGKGPDSFNWKEYRRGVIRG